MNGRLCSACGRRLNPDEHEVAEKRVLVPARRGRGRLGVQRVRVYGCRVRLAATNPATGRVFVPATGQRIKELDIGYRHESRFT